MRAAARIACPALWVLAVVGGCAVHKPHEIVPPAITQAAGCYEISYRSIPNSLLYMLPDSVSLLTDVVGDQYGVRTTPSFRQRSVGSNLVWTSRNDSLWLHQSSGAVWNEFRLVRSDGGWQGVIVGGIDIMVPDSLLRPRGPVSFRQIACLGFM